MSEIRVDTISEKTSANGVAVDGVTLKDGGIAATLASTITTADNTDTLTLKSTDADGNSGPILRLNRDSGSPADGDVIGEIHFNADDDAGNTTSFFSMSANIRDASNGDEDVQMVFKGFRGGNNVNYLEFDGDHVVFNEGSADIDFRVESNGTANMLFVNGGTNKVGIGTDAPAELLEVEGTGAAIQIDSNGDSALRFATSGTVKHSIFSSSGALNFFDNTNSANRWQIDATGNLVPGATSLGIYLGVSSATAANLLDDYEEGVTGNITINSNSGTVSLVSGFKQLAYTKVGRVVHMTGLLKPTTSDASGGINFALPFALADTSDRAEICRGFGYVVNAANANSAGGGLVLEVQTGGSTTCAIIKTTNSANGLTDMNTTYIAAGGTEISVDFSYIAA